MRDLGLEWPRPIDRLPFYQERGSCCRWHSRPAIVGADGRLVYHRHAACISCDEPMPMVSISLAGIPHEHLCGHCTRWAKGILNRAPRFLRRAPVPRRAPEETFAVKP